MSHPRCIMVSSRKHHRSVLRYRPDRGRDHVIGAEPTQGMAGRVREPRRWRLGVGPSEGSGPVFFAFSDPPAPARRDGRHVPGIHNESRNQDNWWSVCELGAWYAPAAAFLAKALRRRRTRSGTLRSRNQARGVDGCQSTASCFAGRPLGRQRRRSRSVATASTSSRCSTRWIRSVRVSIESLVEDRYLLAGDDRTFVHPLVHHVDEPSPPPSCHLSGPVGRPGVLDGVGAWGTSRVAPDGG